MNDQHGIRIVAVPGSVRAGNFTAKALALVVDELRKDPKVSVELFDPARIPLPLPGTGINSPEAKALQDAVQRATAIVLATPEYHGTMSSVMKLVIENLGFPSVLKGKPVSLLGVAAGEIGAIKALEHLRGVVSHVGGLVLPGTVSVARVQTLFDAEGRCLEPRVEARIRTLATLLMEYIHGAICPGIALEEMIRSKAVA